MRGVMGPTVEARRGMKVRSSVKKMCDGCRVSFVSFFLFLFWWRWGWDVGWRKREKGGINVLIQGVFWL